MKIYKSVWHTDLWVANNCKQEDINSFFEVFNKLAKELLELEDDKPSSDGINIAITPTKSKFLVFGSGALYKYIFQTCLRVPRI